MFCFVLIIVVEKVCKNYNFFSNMVAAVFVLGEMVEECYLLPIFVVVEMAKVFYSVFMIVIENMYFVLLPAVFVHVP